MMELILLLLGFYTSWQTFYNSEMILDACRVRDTLYLATNGGILKTQLDDTLKVLYRYTNLDGLRSPVINSIKSDDRGNLWAISDHHLYFKPSTGSLFTEYPGLPLNDSLSWIELRGDWVFISTDLRIIKIDTRGTPAEFDDDLVYHYLLSDLGAGSAAKRVRIFGDTIYIVTGSALSYAQVENFPNDLVVVPIDSLPAGNLGEIRDFVKIGNIQAFLANNSVIFRDFQGTWKVIQWAYLGNDRVWFCCYNTISPADTGIFVGLGGLIARGNRFLRKLPVAFIDTTGRATVFSPDTILCNSDYVHISAVIPFAGKTIIGTVCNQSSSINHNNRKSGGITWIYDNGWRSQRLGLLENNFISGIKKTPDGKIWIYSSYYKIPTYSSRLFVYDHGTFMPVGDFNHGYSVDLVLDAEVDRDGNVWVATNGNGVFKFDSEGNLLEHMFSGESIRSIGFTSRGDLIYTSNDGTFVRTDNGEVALCPLTRVLSISTDGDGNIWIGDENDGFIVFDENYNTLVTSSDFPAISRITVRNIVHISETHYIATTEGIVLMEGLSFKGKILPDVWVYSLDVDPAGYLWALSISGIYVIDTRDNSIKAFFSSLNSGFPVQSMGRDRPFDFMTIRDDILVDPERGSVWVGTPSGLSRVQVNLYENYGIVHGVLKVIPSPVRPGDDYITISGINGDEPVFLYRIDGARVKVEFIRGDGFVRFRTDKLSPGTYFFLAGDKKVSFSVIK